MSDLVNIENVKIAISTANLDEGPIIDAAIGNISDKLHAANTLLNNEYYKSFQPTFDFPFMIEYHRSEIQIPQQLSSEELLKMPKQLHGYLIAVSDNSNA